MERAIPILQALIDVDPHKHYYFGQLGFALKDGIKPNWQAAKTNFDRAIEMAGDDADSWPFYNFNRAICSIRLDSNFADGKPSDVTTRNAIVQDLRAATRGLGNLDEMVAQPY